MALVLSKYKNNSQSSLSSASVSYTSNWSIDMVRSGHDLKSFKSSISHISTLEYIKGLDTDTKIIDWYRVLGIRELGFKASASQIKKAYRNALFVYHPDKCVNKEVVLEESQFVYVTKAYEILSDPVKRNAFDSVDPEFDDRIPSKDVDQSEFFHVFSQVFERNARWSKYTTVPMLGDMSTPIDQVVSFYDFWHGFVSIRDFSMHDEEKVDASACREERREVERINKKARQKMIQDEFNRIKTLVDNCESCDPRMIQHKENLRNEKLEKQKKREQTLREQRERRLAWQRANMNLGKQETQVNKSVETEVAVKTCKVQKQKLSGLKSKLRKFVQNHNYFVPKIDTVQFRQYRLDEMGHFDNMLRFMDIDSAQSLLDEVSNTLDQTVIIQAYNRFITNILTKNNIHPDRSYLSKFTDMPVQVENIAETVSSINISAETNPTTADDSTQTTKITTEQTETSNESGADKNVWNTDVEKIFFKAAKLYQTGTAGRYEKITSYINSHCNTDFNTKQIISKVKSISAKNIVVSNKPAASAATPAETTEPKNTKNDNEDQTGIQTPTNPTVVPWTALENKIFQEALKAIRPNDPNRWKLVAQRLPGRTEDDCKHRMKILINLINKKNQPTKKK